MKGVAWDWSEEKEVVEQMAGHIKNLDIDHYRGLNDVCLRDLNAINILTGNNNSGKTSVPEVLSGIGNPESIHTWIKMCRLGRTGNYYAGILNLFPVDSDRLSIKFSYEDLDGYQAVALGAQIQEERISETDIDKINGQRTGMEGVDIGRGSFFEAKRLHTGYHKNIPWEEYAAIQKDFVLLETITDL